jgi:phenylacetic acid degradation protein PaaD
LDVDRAAEMLGHTVESVGPGSAVVSMTVRDDMVNGLGVCHGGLIFTLADSAMAHASNSHGQPAFAVSATVDFVAPARPGAVLRAEAHERFRRGRTALYDVEVTDDAGTLIARFHGRTQHPSR